MAKVSIVSMLLSFLMIMGMSSAFTTGPSSSSRTLFAVNSRTLSTTTSLNVFGKKKTAEQKAEEEAKAAMYWAGEWVCKDCGYIYDRVSSANIILLL